MRTVIFKSLSDFITKTFNVLCTKIIETPTLGLEAFFPKTSSDCRRIQFGEYQVQEPGETLYKLADCSHMDVPSDMNLRVSLLNAALEALWRKRSGGMFVKWLENVLSLLIKVLLTMINDGDRFEEYLDQFANEHEDFDIMQRFMEESSGAKVLCLLGLKHVAGTWRLPEEIIPELMLCLGKVPPEKEKSSRKASNSDPANEDGEKRVRKKKADELVNILSEQVAKF